MSSENWYRQKLNELQNKDTRLDALTEIKNQLSSDIPEATIVANFLNSPEVFRCLDEVSRDNEQTNLMLDILSMCMSTLDLDRSDYTEILQRSLSHSNAKVQALALNEIVKYLRKNRSVTALDLNLTMMLIGCLDEAETSVGAQAIEILSRILITNFNNRIIKHEIMKRCDNSTDDVIRCRVYEVAVNLAKHSPAMLNDVEEILIKMLTEIDNQDVLLQLNVLELLVSLAEQNHGLVYLESKQVFEKISKRIEQISENPLDIVLMPGFIKFFGKIAYSQPQRIISGYPNIIQCLFDCVASEDASILPTAFDTLGNLAHSSQGKLLLDENYSENMVECFQALGNHLQNLPTDLKIRLLYALEVIFKTEGPISREINEITKRWWRYFSDSTDFRILLEFCKNPFPEIKNACLFFVKTLCVYKWGVLAVRDTAGFVEYLLDRRVEFNQDALFLKYEINKILSTASKVFDVHTILQLKKYVEEGSNYVEGVVEIAVEGGN